MDTLKRTPWRDAALDIVMSQTIALGEMSSLLGSLQEEQKHAAVEIGVFFATRAAPSAFDPDRRWKMRRSYGRVLERKL